MLGCSFLVLQIPADKCLALLIGGQLKVTCQLQYFVQDESEGSERVDPVPASSTIQKAIEIDSPSLVLYARSRRNCSRTSRRVPGVK